VDGRSSADQGARQKVATVKLAAIDGQEVDLIERWTRQPMSKARS